MAEHTPKLLDQLGIAPERFIDYATQLMKQFGSALGAPAHLAERCATRQLKYLRGVRAAKAAFEREAA